MRRKSSHDQIALRLRETGAEPEQKDFDVREVVDVALTPKQERFVQEYLVDLNATQAAIRAGYTKNRASELGYQLLQKTTVQAALKAAMDERSKRIEISQDYVLMGLREIADQEASDAAASELKYSSKLKALELLGKHLGMFTDRVENKVDAAVRIELGAGLDEMAE